MPHQSKKNTRKWCKGKKGKEHKPRWVRDRRFSWPSAWFTYECEVCGKQLDYCCPLPRPRSTDKCRCGNHP